MKLSIFRILTALCCGWAATSLLAQRIVLVAGGGQQPDKAPAKDVQLILPFGIDADRSGNLYLVEMAGGERVRRVDRNGWLTTIAGTGEKGNDGDGGPALKARFNGMHNLAVAANGDIYLADTWNRRVRMIDHLTAVVSTLAGTGAKGFNGDGDIATRALFGDIYCVALDPRGENLYLADLDNRRVRRVHLKTGLVTTVAGNGETGVPRDGAKAVASPLVDPRAVAIDSHGRIFILERSGHALRMVDPEGQIHTVVGTGKPGRTGDGGDARLASLNGPKHLCLDLDENLIIADTENHLIRKFLPREGKIVSLAGTGKKGAAGLGGPPDKAELNQPHGVYVNPSGTLYIADTHNHRILRIEP